MTDYTRGGPLAGFAGKGFQDSAQAAFADYGAPDRLVRTCRPHRATVGLAEVGMECSGTLG
jgi:hypothetical protein